MLYSRGSLTFGDKEPINRYTVTYEAPHLEHGGLQKKKRSSLSCRTENASTMTVKGSFYIVFMSKFLLENRQEGDALFFSSFGDYHVLIVGLRK